MTVAESSLAPASAYLEAELKRQVKAKGIAIWLDADHSYSDFVSGLAERACNGSFPFPVLRFDGSFLELMLALEPYGSGLQPEKLLVHMPGFNHQSIGETPLLELYESGKQLQIALDSVIEGACKGILTAEEGKAFRAGKPTLTEADARLTAAQSGEKDTFLLLLESYSAEAVLDELFRDTSTLCLDVVKADNVTRFVGYLERHWGLPAERWLALLQVHLSAPRGEHLLDQLVEQLRFVAASWLMAVEFVTDLAEPAHLEELRWVRERDKGIQAQGRTLVARMREQLPEDYRLLAARFGSLLEVERTGHQPDALGSIDTFEFEEAAVRGAALSAIVHDQPEVALRYATDRHPERCFWVRHEKGRALTWKLIELGGQVGSALARHQAGVKKCASLEEASNRYRDGLYEVDAAHRAFEQALHGARSQALEDEVRLQEARDVLRRRYRAWVNALTADFAELCEQLGPLPAKDLRQREVYEQFVHPVIESGQRVAFFMVDALRFEMAAELRDYFASKKYTTQLNARLAELPTITAVGMNALAPVSQQGRLRPVVAKRKFEGLRSGTSFTVDSPDSRVRAMATRSVGGEAIQLGLGELTEFSPDELKKKLATKRASQLIVVCSLELDDAGEKGFHLGTFDHTLRQLRDAVQRLQRAGISRFVLASDHGFLLQDETAEKVSYHDGPSRRHVLSSQPAGMVDALEIPLRALDYDVEHEAYLVFRKDTAVWKTQEKIAPFVHGGNSLQERVIPVLCLEKRGKTGASTALYEVVATALPADAGRDRLSLRVRLQKQSSGLLSFAGPQRISLGLRVLGRDGKVLDVLPHIVEVTPPGSQEGASVWVPPGADAATVVFAIEGPSEEKVRVEVYHPDGTEKVTSKIVEGWFEMRLSPSLRGRERRASNRAPASLGQELPQSDAGSLEQQRVGGSVDWADGIEDAEFRKALEVIESAGSINEQELNRVLKSPRRVRAFARGFDELKKRVPFDVQITTVGGMKNYVKGDKR